LQGEKAEPALLESGHNPGKLENRPDKVTVASDEIVPVLPDAAIFIAFARYPFPV